jgi:hypothetical protein
VSLDLVGKFQQWLPAASSCHFDAEWNEYNDLGTVSSVIAKLLLGESIISL